MKETQEYPELIDETLVSLSEACKHFPVPVSRPSVERLWRRGQRGVVLRTIFLVGRRYTSIEEIRRFIIASQRTGDAVPAEPTPTMTKKEIDEARKKYKLPPAGRNGVAVDPEMN